MGVENLPIYVDAGVVPIDLISNRATNGMGFTLEPKDFQVAPVEAGAILGFAEAETVAIIYDPQTYTKGIAEEVRTALEAGVPTSSPTSRPSRAQTATPRSCGR